MSVVPALNYERQPPVGNTLIDNDADGVFIRILPDRSLGRGLSWVFVICGCGVFLFAIVQLVWSPMTLLQSIPILFLSALFFLLAATMRYTPRRSYTTIQASAAGIEYAANEFAPRVIERKQIRRVFTRNAPFSSLVYLGLNLADGGEMVLGCGEPKEVEAMARALHRVLNGAQHGADHPVYNTR